VPFVGGFNKLCIADGHEAIDQEFQRLLPVIRQAGTCREPTTSRTQHAARVLQVLYRPLREVMAEAGAMHRQVTPAALLQLALALAMLVGALCHRARPRHPRLLAASGPTPHQGDPRHHRSHLCRLFDRVIVIVGGLIYLPMLILGPIGERIVS